MSLNISFIFFALNDSVVISLCNQIIKDLNAIEPQVLFFSFLLRVFKSF
jgi:hypothetical protein